MRSSAEVLGGNRVKLSVEIDEDELEGAVSDTMSRLQRELRVPGFRPGKVPRRLLEARLGPKAIREEVIRNSLGDYYAQAVEEAALDTIAPPEIDITAGDDAGPLIFDAVVEVRPQVSVGGYEGLQIEVPSPVATDEMVDARVDALREQFAQLNEVGRPARSGDVVTIDVSGTRGGEPVEDLSTTDFVYEIGSEMIGPGVDEKLVGSKAGDILDVEEQDAPGGPANLKILVKMVREKMLPEPDDDWASEASEFDTIEELRADLRQQLGAMRRLQANYVLRESVVTELAKLVHEEIPTTLIEEELQHLQSHFLQRLSERKVQLADYLEATGQELDQLVADLRTQATEQVRADLALRALAAAEQIEVTDDDLASELSSYAESVNRPVETVARQFAEGAGLERLRSEIRNSKAVTWLVEHVDAVDEQGNPMDKALLLGSEGVPEPPEDSTEAPVAAVAATVDKDQAGETEEEEL